MSAARCPADFPHVPTAPPTAERLPWTAYDGTSMRSRFCTCTQCADILYEWGVAGGVWRIRRTNLKTGAVHMTPAVPRRTSAAWWEALLDGRAF